MEVMKHFYRLSGLIQALLISWMIHQAMAEGRVLEYKPLDFGLQVAGVQDSEIECLTRNIYFEAATEDGFGKLAVAMATLNRVRHPRFPNTICGVVYQGPRIKHKTWACQFSWFCDGKSDRMRDKRLRKESRRIATLALLFPEKDITLGATHYHANYVNPIWAQKLTLTTQFGRHIFYR